MTSAHYLSRRVYSLPVARRLLFSEPEFQLSTALSLASFFMAEPEKGGAVETRSITLWVLVV